MVELVCPVERALKMNPLLAMMAAVVKVESMKLYWMTTDLIPEVVVSSLVSSVRGGRMCATPQQ